MNRPILLSLFLFYSLSLGAQPEFERVDSIIRALPQGFTDVAALTRQLSQPFETEREKARAIFTWVSLNIRYDYQKQKNPPPQTRISGTSAREIEKNLRDWREKEIRSILLEKKGVCGDYCKLIQKMYELAGLESVFIGGVARSLGGYTGKHAWNAVKFDGSWHFLDATWGAGFVNLEEDRFIPCFRPALFGTTPEMFILNHFPDETEWQLLDNPISRKEFDNQPIVNFSNADYPIQEFIPENGKIIPEENGSATIRLKLDAMPKAFVVTAGETTEIPSDVSIKDYNWVVLRFTPGNASGVCVYAGKSREKMTMLVQFDVE